MNDAANLTGVAPQRDTSKATGAQAAAPPAGMRALLGSRNFRFQWPADLLTSWAFEMETLILGWYILAETGSVMLLTVFAALQYLGTLIAPIYGVAGDRIGPRRLLCMMRAAYTILAGALTITISCGWLSPLTVFIIAGLNGLVRPSDIAVRSSLVAEYMPPSLLVGAMGMSRTTSDTARLFGALAGAGLFALLGLLPAYVMVTSLYLISVALTMCVSRSPTYRAMQKGASVAIANPTPWQDLKEGMTYIWNTPHLLAALSVAFLINMTAYPVTNGMLPYVARNVYEIDQVGLGYLAGGFAFGALLGSIGLSVARRLFPLAAMMIVSTLIWYGLLLIFAQLHTLLSGTVTLILAGFVQSLCLVPLAVILLRTSNPALRSRVMGVRMLAIYGLPVGLLAAGALVDIIGFRWMLTTYSLVGIASICWIAAYWRTEIWPRHARANVA